MHTKRRLKRERIHMLAKPQCEGLVIGSPKADKFLEEIKADKCTGYMKIEVCHRTFLLFFEEGIPTYGFRVVEGQLFSYSNLSRVLHSLEGARMNFVETYAGVLQALLDRKFGKKMYGTLYTTFIDVKKLFSMLNHKKHTGSVEVDLPSNRYFVIVEHGTPKEVVCCSYQGEEKEEKPVSFESMLTNAASQNGVVRVYERKNPPTIVCPHLKEKFVWSEPRRLKLEFAFGQLGKEFEELLDQNMTISQILNTLRVDFEEIVDMYTYLSAKGYIAIKKES
jgi:hypothetical protein